MLDDLPGAEVLFVGVGTDKVEVELWKPFTASSKMSSLTCNPLPLQSEFTSLQLSGNRRRHLGLFGQARGGQATFILISYDWDAEPRDGFSLGQRTPEFSPNQIEVFPNTKATLTRSSPL
jgi:hypothetical protein